MGKNIFRENNILKKESNIILISTIIIFIYNIIKLNMIISYSPINEITINEILRSINLNLSITAMVSALLCYVLNSKIEMLLMFMIYLVFTVDASINFYSDYILESCFSMLGSLIIITLLVVANFMNEDIEEYISSNKGKISFIVIIFTSIFVILEYKTDIALIHNNLGIITHFNLLKISIYCILGVSFFEKSYRNKQYIYALIGSISIMFAIKSMFATAAHIYHIDRLNLAAISITYMTYILFSLGIIIELTQIVSKTKELNQKKKLFFNIFEENSHSNILVTDINNNVIYANKKFIENNKNIIDKYKSIRNINISDISLIKNPDKLKECIENNKYYNEIIKIDKENISSNTDSKYIGKVIDVSVQQFNDSKNIYKIIDYRYITERYDMEQKILELENIKKEEKMKNEFFANVSHELKTPLNIIYSTFQLLDSNINDEKDLKYTYLKYRNILDMNTKRMLRLIDNIVDTTKIEVGYANFKYKNMDIVKLVEDITLSVVNYAKCKDISVTFDTEIEELNIKVDIYVIERIMLNLLSNAIKFTNNGGEIFVNISLKDNFVIIKVKDNGIGISKELQDSIFERFVQEDKSLRRENEGSGIGLSLVKSLVEKIGGSISIYSDGINGSEFTLMLKNEYCEECNYKEDYTVDNEKIKLELSDIYEIYENI